MADSRLTENGFRTIVRELHRNGHFRHELLSDKPAQAVAGTGLVSTEDERRLAAMKWSDGLPKFGEIDEKLVLCSSSGY